MINLVFLKQLNFTRDQRLIIIKFSTDKFEKNQQINVTKGINTSEFQRGTRATIHHTYCASLHRSRPNKAGGHCTPERF